MVDEKRKKPKKVTRGDNKWAGIEADVPEISMSASYKKEYTMMNVVAFSK